MKVLSKTKVMSIFLGLSICSNIALANDADVFKINQVKVLNIQSHKLTEAFQNQISATLVSQLHELDKQLSQVDFVSSSIFSSYGIFNRMARIHNNTNLISE